MDEPFSALDAITRDQMNEALSEIMDKTAKTVIFVTHSIREAAFLSDRVVVMGGRPSHVVLDERMPFGGRAVWRSKRIRNLAGSSATCG